jgi:hypothetical protein
MPEKIFEPKVHKQWPDEDEIENIAEKMPDYSDYVLTCFNRCG